MKIDVSGIVSDHLATLRDDGGSKLSFSDLFIFFVIPILAGLVSYWLLLSLKDEAYNASLTFFGIFIALLLNIQVGMFGIFQRKWDISADPRVAEIQQAVLQTRKKLLTELNANISYLVLVCCVALVLALVLYVRQVNVGIAPAIMIGVYLHFLLTLLMIVKRAHALFHKEYRDSPA